jgi:hypothetical protein
MHPSSFDKSEVEQRRLFLRDLENRDEVVKVDFTRDGFRTIYAQIDRDAGFHRDLQERAKQAGYGVEHLNAGIYRLEYDENR